MSLKNFVTLGRSGLRVSPLCLGAMTFGEDWGWGASVAESEAMISAYLDRGGNFIDTANIYTNGHSEKIIGDFFKARKGTRDRAVIGTKFYCSLFDGDPNGGGAGRKAMIQQCEESLRRLQTDYIDLYWLHNWDITAPIDETMRALDDLVRAGKIRYVAFSDIPAWRTAEAQTIAAFREALRLKPQYAEALSNLGLALLSVLVVISQTRPRPPWRPRQQPASSAASAAASSWVSCAP